MRSILLMITAFVFLQCSRKADENAPTFGTVKIAADESLENIIEEEKAAFEGIYQNAALEIVYLNEEQVIRHLLSDSVDLAIMTRPLNDEEQQQIQEQKIWPEMTKVAYDAVAVLANVSNPDSSITDAEIADILSGKIQVWNQLKSDGLSDSLMVIFDQNNSGVARYMKDSVTRERRLGANVYAANGNAEVIEYVRNNRNAIGFIGVNWISDGSSAAALRFRNEVRVVSIAQGTENLYYKPYQAYVAQKTYPFIRPVYAISREGRAGLASGFTAFLASERGQRIILKSGLVPVTMPLRIVQLPEQNNE